ncbi:MAG TPA: tetratricopeptide repeat protein [Chloroflexota bacterium]|nr:tetratricopeptide repeat protein [Chloroflexota bacterium]
MSAPRESSRFAQLLLRYRKAAGLTQEELAERAHLSARAISDLERGLKHTPRRDTIALLAEALALPDSERTALEEMVRPRRAVWPEHACGRGGDAALPSTHFQPASSVPLPLGTVTFLLTDIEDSTALWDRGPREMAVLVVRHDTVVNEALATFGGVRVKEQGKGGNILAVFTSAGAALAAACTAQRALLAEDWPSTEPLRVRMGLHTGEIPRQGSSYHGAVVNRAVRIGSLGHGGQILLSAATAALVGADPPEDISLVALGQYLLEGFTRPEQIFQAIHPDLPATFPPLAGSLTPHHNLPIPVTSFIGREREQAEVLGLLDDARLVTLVGAGGVGKTRLAVAVASVLVERFPDGVWLTELAPLRGSDASLVPEAVAQAVGLREEPRRSILATLTDHLTDKQLLLVLDNCEHQLEATAALVSAVLRLSPGVHLLVTSREALGVGGEVQYRVPSLSMPDPRRLPERDVLGSSEAIRLFVARARARLPGFELDERTAPAVVAVCARLDGIPLAIELAAARVGNLPVEVIAERLDDRFRLLTSGPRDAPSRQQTLRAAMDWSWDLLAASEKRLLQRLSVFAGGWTLEPAETVCLGDGIERRDVWNLLDGLTSKSLVQLAERDGEARYQLLETVRLYAAERLATSGEEAAIRDRHLAWCLALAEKAEPYLTGREQQTWLTRLEYEHDNLRTALRWSIQEDGAPATGARLAVALGRFWVGHGHSNTQHWFESVLQFDTVAPITRAKALYWLGGQARECSEGERARGLFEESLALARDLGAGPEMALALNALASVTDDPRRSAILIEEAITVSRRFGYGRGAALAIGQLGTIAWDRGEYDRAGMLVAESLARHREGGDWREVAMALLFVGRLALDQGDIKRAGVAIEESLTIFQDTGNAADIMYPLEGLGAVAHFQGEYQRARKFYKESLALGQAHQRRWAVLQALLDLAQLAYDQGERDQARALYEESLPQARSVGDPLLLGKALGGLGLSVGMQGGHRQARALITEGMDVYRGQGFTPGIAMALHHLGRLALAEDDPEQARTLLAESLTLRRIMGAKLGIVECLEGLGLEAWTQGQAARAAMLLGAAHALREALGAPLPPGERPFHDRAQAALHLAPSKDVVAAAWTAGTAMALEETIALAVDAKGDSVV